MHLTHLLHPKPITTLSWLLGFKLDLGELVVFSVVILWDHMFLSHVEQLHRPLSLLAIEPPHLVLLLRRQTLYLHIIQVPILRKWPWCIVINVLLTCFVTILQPIDGWLLLGIGWFIIVMRERVVMLTSCAVHSVGETLIVDQGER